MADQSRVMLLVAYPFLLGAVVGWALHPIFVIASVLVLGTYIISGINAMPAQLPPLEGLSFRLFTIAFVWFSLGFGGGLSAKRYMSSVGLGGYIFTLCRSLIGLSLVSLFIEGVLPYISGNPQGPAILRDAFGFYGTILSFCFLYLPLAGSHLARAGWRGVFQSVAVVFTVFGLLELAISQLFQGFLSDLLWWVAPVGKPEWYGLFVDLGIGILLTFPAIFDPIHELGLPPAGQVFPGATKETALQSDVLTINLGRYSVPGDFRVRSEERTPFQYNLRLEPADAGFFDRASARRGRIEVAILPYPSPDRDRATLKTIADANILPDGGQIVKESFGRRHGATSYECRAKTQAHFVYFMLFMVEANAVFVKWTCASPDLYQQGIQKTILLTNSFVFDRRIEGGETDA